VPVYARLNFFASSGTGLEGRERPLLGLDIGEQGRRGAKAAGGAATQAVHAAGALLPASKLQCRGAKIYIG
jgi:hypothetical protein